MLFCCSLPVSTGILRETYASVSSYNISAKKATTFAAGEKIPQKLISAYTPHKLFQRRAAESCRHFLVKGKRICYNFVGNPAGGEKRRRKKVTGKAQNFPRAAAV